LAILNANSKFGRFRLIRKIRSDRCVVVYAGFAEAGDPFDGCELAIHVLHEHLTEEPGQVAAFRREGAVKSVAAGPEGFVLEVGTQAEAPFWVTRVEMADARCETVRVRSRTRWP
jgi:hypothetical protein